MRSTVSRFSKLMLLSVSLSFLPLNLWGQITIFPEKPLQNKDAKIFLSESRPKDTEVEVTIDFLGTDVENVEPIGAPEKERIPKNAGAVLHTFPEAGYYSITAIVPQANGAIRPVFTRVNVRPEVKLSPQAIADQKALKTASATSADEQLDLGLSAYIAKLYEERFTDLAKDQDHRQLLAIMAEVFEKSSQIAPSVGLSESPGDKAIANAFVDQEIKKARDAIEKARESDWSSFPRLTGGAEHPSKKIFFDFLNTIQKTLKEDIYEKDFENKEFFKWDRAMRELADGLREAEEEFTAFIKAYKEKHQDIYDKYMESAGAGGSTLPTHRGPNCPLLIYLGAF